MNLHFYFLCISALLFSREIHSQDFSSPEGQKNIEHRNPTYSGIPIKKFSENILRFSLTNDKFVSAPAVYGDTVYAGTDSGSIICATRNGIKQICKSGGGGAIAGAPAITKDYIYAGFKNNIFAAFSRADGKLIWKYETKGSILTSPLLHEEYIYFTTSSGYLYSLKAESGGFRWKFNALAQAGAPLYEKNIALGTDAIFIGTDRQRIYAVNSRNGDKIWEFSGAGFQPLLNESDIYCAEINGYVHSIDRTTGRGVWHFVGDLERGTTDFACSDHTLCFGNGRRLIAMDSRAGEGFKWQKHFPKTAGAPIIVGDVVYALCDDGNLYALNLNSGEELSHLAIGTTTESSLAFSNGNIVVANGKEILFIVKE